MRRLKPRGVAGPGRCRLLGLGAWRSLVAHQSGGLVVVGSNPAAPTNTLARSRPSGRLFGFRGRSHRCRHRVNREMTLRHDKARRGGRMHSCLAVGSPGGWACRLPDGGASWWHSPLPSRWAGPPIRLRDVSLCRGRALRGGGPVIQTPESRVSGMREGSRPPSNQLSPGTRGPATRPPCRGASSRPERVGFGR